MVGGRVVLWGILLLVTAQYACGTSSSVRRSPSPPPARARGDEPPPDTPAFAGPWVLPGKEFEIRGFSAAGLRGTDLVIYLKRTRWSETAFEGATFREGYAELEVASGGRRETVRIDMEGRQVVAGYEITVVFVGQEEDEASGRIAPNARLIVRRPR